jgi:hypothetical protein
MVSAPGTGIDVFPCTMNFRIFLQTGYNLLRDFQSAHIQRVIREDAFEETKIIYSIGFSYTFNEKNRIRHCYGYRHNRHHANGLDDIQDLPTARTISFTTGMWRSRSINLHRVRAEGRYGVFPSLL